MSDQSGDEESDQSGDEESSKPPDCSNRLCSAGTEIQTWLPSGRLVLSYTVTEEMEEEVAILGVLKYLCNKWRLPDSCLEAAWKSPMGSACDATLILRRYDGLLLQPAYLCPCDVCHVPVNDLPKSLLEARRQLNMLCVLCKPSRLCDLCRVTLPPHVVGKTDDGIPVDAPWESSMRTPVCIRCVREEDLAQADPRLLWLHSLRRRCLGLEDRERESLLVGKRNSLAKRERELLKRIA